LKDEVSARSRAPCRILAGLFAIVLGGCPELVEDPPYPDAEVIDTGPVERADAAIDAGFSDAELSPDSGVAPDAELAMDAEVAEDAEPALDVEIAADVEIAPDVEVAADVPDAAVGRDAEAPDAVVDAGFDAGVRPDVGLSLRGGLSSGGGALQSGTLRLRDGRLETRARICAGSLCLTGGIEP
jgi:hypothetical protein